MLCWFALRSGRDPRARCIAAERLVERRAAAVDAAAAQLLADPGNRQAEERLDAAEELHYIAADELRRARRALERAQRPGLIAALRRLVRRPL